MKVRLFLGLTVTWLALVDASAALPKLSENDFKGAGICQFATHGFTLAASTDNAVNLSVRQLIERHRAVFGFQARPDFRLRMRMFGNYADYTNATFSLYWTNAADRRALAGRPFNVAGFYTSATKEIVTWRQQLPGFLGTTLLHEASHAIMDAHYENVPLWMMEGAADYFAFALHPPGEVQQQMVRHRWTRLHEWLRDKSLLPLETLLNADVTAFRNIDAEKSYAMSWSVFQLLMSSPLNRQIAVRLLNERQSPDGLEIPCAGQMDQLYPGGLKKLEPAWHAWILSGSHATNAPTVRPSRP
jgi:hypothetical protein